VSRHTGELRRKGGTDRDAVWGDLCESKDYVLNGVQILPREGALLRGHIRPINLPTHSECVCPAHSADEFAFTAARVT